MLYRPAANLKTLTAIVVTLVILLVFAFSGALFRFWPTSWPDEPVEVTPAALAKLQTLRQQPKFNPDPRVHYPGAPSELVRRAAELRVNGTIDALLAGLPTKRRKSFILSSFKAVLISFDHFDSEERDRLNWYLEEIMDIVGVRNSNELLNVWRYGLPYGWLTPSA